ncbi:MAG: TolC family protein [Candidatus Margulisiibacteriota bacterium]
MLRRTPQKLSVLLVLLVLVFSAAAGTGAAAETKLTLDQSYEIALEQSPTVQKARAQIRAAEGTEGRARSGFLPHLAVSGGFGKYYSHPSTVQITSTGTSSVFSFGTNEQADASSYGATFSQAVFTGGRLVNTLGAANKGLEITKEELRRTEQALKYNVASAYYNVLKNIKLVELNRQSVEMAEHHLANNQALFKAGIATRAEVLRGEVLVAQNHISLIRSEQGLELTKNSFNNVLGNALDTPVELAEANFSTGEVVIYNYRDLLPIAYESQPEWRQYLLGKKIRSDELGVAYSGLFPNISLAGTYSGGLTRYSAYQSDQATWSALVSGSWNIFDGTDTLYKIKEAGGRLDAEIASEENVRRNLALSVKDANFIVKSAKEDMVYTAKAVELAEENYKIADLRYNSGAGNNLEVLDAQVSLTRARTDNVDAQNILQLAKAKLNQVLGREIY